jgi:hypothetical protein
MILPFRAGSDGMQVWTFSSESPSSSMALLRKIVEANKQLPVLGAEVAAKITAALDIVCEKPTTAILAARFRPCFQCCEAASIFPVG